MLDKQEIVYLQKIFEHQYPSVILSELILMIQREALDKDNDESSIDKSAVEICSLAMTRLREIGR